MNIVGKKVILRAIEKEDCEFLREMINSPEMEKNVVGWSFPVSRSEQILWYENQICDKSNLRFIIEYNKLAVGLVVLTSIDWKNRCAGHGIKLYSESVRRKGIGTEVVRLIMRYAFEELQLNRLYITILESNIASQKLYEKCGWTVEGKLRQSIFKGNKYIDELQVSILKDDYEKIKLGWK